MKMGRCVVTLLTLAGTCVFGAGAQGHDARVPTDRTQVVSLSPTTKLLAQTHGVRIGKVCVSPKCVGDVLDCTIEVGNADGFNDSIRVLEAWDVVNPVGEDGDGNPMTFADCPEDPDALPGCRVPTVGNLPIVAVSGNTTCTVGGSLPCFICAGGQNCGSPPVAPISNDPGVVVFRQNTYVVKANDPDPLEDQANVRVQDLCDAKNTQGCSSVINSVQFTAATELEVCCGNNLAEDGEACDGTDAATCNSACRPAGGQDECTCCGDDVLQPNSGEQCDGNVFEDGAPAGHGACRSDCTFCGDGIVNGGEQCDDGNANNEDACRNNCRLPVCGDDNTDPPAETCDGEDDDTCNSDCRPPQGVDPCTCCGDDVLQPNSGEQCDGAAFEDGAPATHGACRGDCTFCGDGIVNGGEQCDDGNANNEDACRNNCLLPVCGDNNTDPPSETCDGADSATCNSACRAPTALDPCTCCGDDVLQATSGEQCDGAMFEDGAPATHGACRSDCTFCGDGIVNGGEQCDDGNANNEDACRNNCLLPVCGDNNTDPPAETCDGTDSATCNSACRVPGVPDPCTCCGDDILQPNSGEQCDGAVFEDGAPATHGACRSDCTFCGDGIVNGGEQCDDGNANNEDACRNNCLLPSCGDNNTDPPTETCDGTDDDTCNSDCRPPQGIDQCTCCGDDVLQPNSGEQCDGAVFEDGAPATHGPCRTDCTFCGDGTTNDGEECDDGNANNLDFCRNDCTLPECGDNIADPGESCDGTDAATCNLPCRAPEAANECTCCGDDVLQPSSGEQCDGMEFEIGAPDSHGPCRTNCTFCGDGTVDTGEECDDGNANNFDSCRNNCTLPECGDNIADPGESCDGTDAATCNLPCREAGSEFECTCCGDGVVQGTEECDDGNLIDDDGCNAFCRISTICGNNVVDQDSETCDGTDDEGCHRACRRPGLMDECTCCGDGIVNGDEDCDDGNDVQTDGCDNKCFYKCGDGAVNRPGEYCDGADADRCNLPCRPAGSDLECTCCGDGILQGDEVCDDGNTVDGDGCTDCRPDPLCGDGVKNGDEQCDGQDDEGCHRACRAPGLMDECTCCGDGVVNGDEDCDDGNSVNDDGCDNKCFYKCGDGVVNRDAETCDGHDDDGCHKDCRPAGSDFECTCCGDGIVQSYEECDDGNSSNDDDCDNKCQLRQPECGDGNVDSPDETCDGDNDTGCTRKCRSPGHANECTCCGDGIVQSGEDCDDGNDVSNDGCATSCRFKCGDGDINRTAETCDGQDAEVCNGSCRPPGSSKECTCCGDGIKQYGEECDDGNKANGDGCSTACRFEAVCGDGQVNDDSETCDGDDFHDLAGPEKDVVATGDHHDDDDDDGDHSGGCVTPCRAPGTVDQCTCCGDGMVNGDEQCDGRDLGNCTDGCNRDCTCRQSVCGDGIVNGPAETCDGNDHGVSGGTSVVATGDYHDDDDDDHGDDGCSCRPPGSVGECTCCGDGVINGNEQCDGDDIGDCSDGCNRDCTCRERGGEGCSPGYWKHEGWNQWPWPYDWWDRVDWAFGIHSTYNPKLIYALKGGGGGESACLRQAVAALLNAAHDGVNYLYTKEEVIAIVQQAYASGQFEHCIDVFDAENNRGCPLNHNNVVVPDDGEAPVEKMGVESIKGDRGPR